MKTTLVRAKQDNEEWPRKIKLGRATVTVYKRLMPNGQPGYLVANYSTGKRRLDSYATESEAIKAANTLVRQLSERNVVAAAMTNAEAAEYAACVQALERFKTPLLSAAQAVADSLDALGGDIGLLTKAAKEYARRHSCVTLNVTVTEAVQGFLEAKRRDGLRERSLTDLEDRLGRFAVAFKMNMIAVTSPALIEWLDALDVGPQSRQNYRRVLHGFFKWSESKGFIFRGENPVAQLPAQKVLRDQHIAIYEPAELRKLLSASDGEFQAALALMAFAGLRPEEVIRLDWRDIDFAEGLIRVHGRSAKTRTTRHVPILETLRAWLRPHQKPAGPIWSGTANQFVNARRQVVKSSGVRWIQDGLRHSFISARLALLKNAATVAGEAGNSEAVIFAHYRNLRTEKQGRAWFSVTPQEPANVVNLPAQAVA